MNFLINFTILLSLFVSGFAETEYSSVVETASGPVRGQILTTVRKLMKFASFTGIPFGEPPLGYLRFKPPVEKKKWSETLNATKQGNVCVQPMSLEKPNVTTGSEDCLYINVYTPHTNFSNSNSTLKPVMFWIYGGGFVTGSAMSDSYRPDFLIEDDVVVVSANYRLGPLGFLNLHHRNATGNAGLKDQTLALKWVKKNIEKFGGDPNKVTIFGQSAGAVSVDYHVLSDLSTGLFHRAISMSGSPLNLYWGLQPSEEAEAEAFALGTKLGVRIKNKDILLSALHSTSAETIIAKAGELPPLGFRVTVEKVFNDEEAFLSECSLRRYMAGRYNKMPYMTGFTSNEAKAWLSVSNSSNAVILKLGLRSLNYGGIPLKIPIFQKFISSPNSFSEEKYKKLSETASDLFFVTGIDSKQRFMNLQNGNPIYYYRFSFDSTTYLEPSKNQSIKGVGHGEDLQYLFYVPGVPINQPDVDIMIKRYVRLMTNFAKYGNPTPSRKEDKEDDLLNISWPNSGMIGRHLEINRNLSIGLRPINTRVRVYELAGAGSSPLLNECIDKSCLSP